MPTVTILALVNGRLTPVAVPALQHVSIVPALTMGSGLRENGRWVRGSVPAAPEGEAEADGSYRSITTTWQLHMAHAGFVLDHAPELLSQVAAGSLALDAAVKDVKDQLEAAANEETARQQEREAIAGLPADLRALVTSDQLK
jgi:hypothetical protein